MRQAALGRGHSPEAFQLYLQGKFYGERVTQADTDKAIDLFQRALAIDPSFALAWAGLSQIHFLQAGYGFAPISEGFERAREAAQNALRLAPDLAEGHIALGTVLETNDWNFAAAEASFRRALELAPGDADALHAAAGLARVVGQSDEALDLIGKAVALDPLSARTHRQAAMVAVMSERFDEAAASFQLALDLAPKAGLNHAFLAIVRLLQGQSPGRLVIANPSRARRVPATSAVAMIQHTLGHPRHPMLALHALIDEFARGPLPSRSRRRTPIGARWTRPTSGSKPRTGSATPAWCTRPSTDC